MKLSVLFPETRSVDNVVALAQHSEQLGFHGMFLGTAFGIDPIMALAYAGTQTSRISLGVAVVPTWPRHPQVLAQQAATANAMCNGRFRLGIGPSHAPVMARLGIPFDRPISHSAGVPDDRAHAARRAQDRSQGRAVPGAGNARRGTRWHSPGHARGDARTDVPPRRQSQRRCAAMAPTFRLRGVDDRAQRPGRRRRGRSCCATGDRRGAGGLDP